jgi:hypothetical protein
LTHSTRTLHSCARLRPAPRIVGSDKIKRTKYVAPEYPRDAVLRKIEGLGQGAFHDRFRRQGRRIDPSCNRRPSACSTGPRSPP